MKVSRTETLRHVNKNGNHGLKKPIKSKSEEKPKERKRKERREKEREKKKKDIIMDFILSSLVSFDSLKNSLYFNRSTHHGMRSVQNQTSISTSVSSFVSSDPMKLESAQSALLVAVIKATPNQVILSVARNYAYNVMKDLVTMTTSYIPSSKSTFCYFPSVTFPSLVTSFPYPLQSLKRIKIAGQEMDTSCIENGSVQRDGIRSDGIRGDGQIQFEMRAEKEKSIAMENMRMERKWMKKDEREKKTDQKYEIIFAFVKLLVKLILNFFLEIISFTLKFI